MSFPRAKNTRFNEKVDRTTALNTGIRQTVSSVNSKSFIPKYRSLSQPPSVLCIKDTQNIGDYVCSKTREEPNNTLGTLFKDNDIRDMGENTIKGEMEIIHKEHSVKSEEFKDCLDIKADNEIKEKVKKEPKDVSNGKKNETTRAGDTRNQSDALTRRNSSSGIPVSTGKSATPRKSPSPKPSPRNTPTTSSIPKKSSSYASSENRIQPQNKNPRTFELFTMKKKRLEQLKKEISDKQKPMMDLYQSLQQLKKKLDDNGKHVTLESLKLVDFGDLQVPAKIIPDKTGGGEVGAQKEPDPKALEEMKKGVKDTWSNLVDMCKSVMEKRNNLIVTVEKYLNPEYNRDDLKPEIDEMKNQSSDIDNNLSKVLETQEELVENLISKWSTLMSQSDLCESKELQLKLKNQESHIKELSAELHKTKQQLKDKVSVENSVLDDELKKYVEKTNALEKQLEGEHKKYVYETEKLKTAEINLKTLKSKLKESDINKQQNESRISQLSQDLRNSQLKIKQIEKNYEKEIAELNKNRHLDKSVIERLNRDRSTFETRLQTATDTIETMKFESEQREAELQADLENTKNDLEVARSERNHLRTECELLQKEVNSLELHTQHAADVISNRKDGSTNGGKVETDREFELQIEVVAQRATIKALQEKVESNAAEKLRFIETIEMMNGTPEGVEDSIVKALVKNEEVITRYGNIIKENEETIVNQKIEIDSLYAKLENLKQQIGGMEVDENNDALKSMLKDGKSKLEQALMKSLENEHKIIKYEHELAQKNQAIGNLENMMKVRDGLIGVMKTKKDEIAMENESLNKYSEEMRNYVLEVKEQLKEKSEIIQELQMLIESGTKETHKMEKRIRELEDTLSLTNEKRYKLQDTVGYMEKELQATKAQISHLEDMQTRYDLGRTSESSAIRSTSTSIGLEPWKANSLQLKQKYQYDYEQCSKALIHKTNTLHLKPQTDDETDEDLQIESNLYGQKFRIVSVKNSLPHGVVPYADEHFENNQDGVFDQQQIDQEIHSIPHFRNPPKNSVFGAGYEYKPIIFKGVDRYKVMKRGDLLWCKPSPEMTLNNMLITKDLIAHSCSKIKQNLDNSLRLIKNKKTARRQ